MTQSDADQYIASAKPLPPNVSANWCAGMAPHVHVRTGANLAAPPPAIT